MYWFGVCRYGAWGLVMRYLLFVFVLFSAHAFSADYTWKNPSGYSYSSVSAGCTAFKTNYGASSYTVVKTSDSVWTCTVNIGYSVYMTLTRQGESCPIGATYDSVKGECNIPPPTDGSWCEPPTSPGSGKTFIISGGVCVSPMDATLANQCKAYSKSPDSGAAVVTTWKYPTNSSEDLRNPQKAANALGCEIQLLKDIDCKTYPPEINCEIKNPDGSCYTSEKTIKCKTNSVLTGNVAPDPFGTPAGSLCTGDECEITPPADLKESKPCTYVYDVNGIRSCTSWDFSGKEGAEQCGTVNGTFSCKNDLPKAVGKGLSIATKIEEETLGDGTKKTTKTDTAKKVVCIGENSCVTSTTTNKTVSIHGADGSLQSTTGTCTGALCADGTSPDGDGDGLGDCTGTDCGDEEGAPIAGPATPELEEQDTYAETTQKFINRAKASPLVSGISGISMPAGGTCNIGAAQTWFGSIDFSSFCQLAPQILAGLRYLFLAIWAWAAIRLFFTA